MLVVPCGAEGKDEGLHPASGSEVSQPAGTYSQPLPNVMIGEANGSCEGEGEASQSAP